MKSFGLNDGRPDGEIVVIVDDDGAVTSAKNVITDTEYVGGGSSDLMSVHYDAETYLLNKTWQEIHDAVANDSLCIVVNSDPIPQIIASATSDGHGGYFISIYREYTSTDTTNYYFCEDADDYPYLD